MSYKRRFNLSLTLDSRPWRRTSWLPVTWNYARQIDSWSSAKLQQKNVYPVHSFTKC